MQLRTNTTYKCERANGACTYVRVLAYDPVERRYQIQTKAGTQYFNPSAYARLTPVREARARGTIAKTRAAAVSLYLLHLGNDTYKVGCTNDVARRVRQARTWAPDVRVVAKRTIPSHTSAQWRRFERALLEEVREGQAPRPTGGREVVRLTHAQADRAAQTLRRMRFAA